MEYLYDEKDLVYFKIEPTNVSFYPFFSTLTYPITYIDFMESLTSRVPNDW